MKFFIIGTLLLFGAIGALGLAKHRANNPIEEKIQEIPLGTSVSPLPPVQQVVVNQSLTSKIPQIDRIAQLFALDSSKLPIVETVSFTSRVPWLKDRSAWIADYAAHYETSRHFIARSLNQKADYFDQKVSLGDRFNVFKKDKKIQFHLLIDLSKCLMHFSYIDLATHEKVLLKTYRVGLGRIDPKSPSGCLTPIGTFPLGEKIVIYKPGVTCFFKQEKTEMIRVFGTRWIPFASEMETARGLGLHGAPWIEDNMGQLVEDKSKIGKFDSDGCIRLAAEDIEELFAIVITKPTMVEIVKEVK